MNENEESREHGKDLKRSSGMPVGKIGLGAAAIALLLLFGKGFGFGAGGSNGIVPGGAEIAVSQTEKTTVEAAAEEPARESGAEQPKEIPSTIIVRIEEDKVYVLDELCETEEALEQRIRELNADDRTFRLEDDHSIYATYLMVDELFRKLEIPLYQEK